MMFMNNFETSDFQEKPHSESIENITKELFCIEPSPKERCSEFTCILEDEGEDSFENKFALIFLSSNHDKNSINSQDNDENRFFTKTKEESNRQKLKIFSIVKKQKINNKLNANKKKESKNKHNKFSEDNIVTKIKTYFVNSLIEYINIIYSKFKKGKQKLLKKISPKFSKAYSKKSNQCFLRLNVKQFVSIEISKRCRDSPDHNEKQIEKLYKQKESEECMKILDSKLSEMYELYTSNEIDEFSLDHDLERLKEKKKESIDYINQFKETANNLIGILSRKGIIKNRRFNCKKYKPSKKKKNNDLTDSSDNSKFG